MDEITSRIPAHLMAPRPEETKAKNTLAKDDFMHLMMVQLQNQDPLNPMDHKEFSAQLAQFGSLEQLSNISGGIDKMRSGMGGEAKLQAVGMIGKTIQAAGNELSLVSGEPVHLRLDSSEKGRAVKASIFDVEGKLVRELPLNARAETRDLMWDGKTADGVAAPEGKYTFRISGIGADGKSKDMNPTVKGEVIGVELEGEQPVLIVKSENGRSKISVNQIRNVGTETPAAAKPGQTPQTKPVAKPEFSVKMPTATEGKPADPAVEESEESKIAAFNPMMMRNL